MGICLNLNLQAGDEQWVSPTIPKAREIVLSAEPSELCKLTVAFFWPETLLRHLNVSNSVSNFSESG